MFDLEEGKQKAEIWLDKVVPNFISSHKKGIKCGLKFKFTVPVFRETWSFIRPCYVSVSRRDSRVWGLFEKNSTV